MNKTGLAGVLLALTLSTPLLAQGFDEEGMIKYRKNLMKAASAHLKSSGAILEGKVPFQGDLAKHARALADLGPMIAAGFPEGSDFGETDAKPEVWAKRGEFDKAADDYTRAAAAFAADPTAAAMERVGETCKGCHKPFRAK